MTWLDENRNKLSRMANRVFINAKGEARKRGENDVDTDQILLCLLKERNCVARRIVTQILHDDDDIRGLFSTFGLRSENAARKLFGGIADSTDASYAQIPLSQRAQQALELAGIEARRFNCPCIETQHLLLGVLLAGTTRGTIAMFQSGVTVDEVRKQMLRMPRAELRFDASAPSYPK